MHRRLKRRNIFAQICGTAIRLILVRAMQQTQCFPSKKRIFVVFIIHPPLIQVHGSLCQSVQQVTLINSRSSHHKRLPFAKRVVHHQHKLMTTTAALPGHTINKLKKKETCKIPIHATPCQRVTKDAKQFKNPGYTEISLTPNAAIPALHSTPPRQICSEDFSIISFHAARSPDRKKFIWYKLEEMIWHAPQHRRRQGRKTCHHSKISDSRSVNRSPHGTK